MRHETCAAMARVLERCLRDGACVPVTSGERVACMLLADRGRLEPVRGKAAMFRIRRNPAAATRRVQTSFRSVGGRSDVSRGALP